MSAMERLLRMMADNKASDLYLSVNAPVMVKVRGETIAVNNQLLSTEAPLKLLSEIVSAESIEELRNTGELNVGVPIKGVGRFRVSAMRQRGTYAVVIRFIPRDIPDLQDLRLPPIIESLSLEKRGLILVVGSTGSGKSTTIASMMDLRNKTTVNHILTIEDPIEYTFHNKRSIINQREVGSDTASLQVGLKNALRQAPDVIQIGEIRDRETMSAALAYAQSGHLCISTLHANNSYHALNRILSFYPVEVRPTMLGDLAATLKAIISQRLLRGMDGERIPAVEVLLNTKRISELIEASNFSGIRDAMQQSMSEGSQTFEESLAQLVAEDLVDRKAAFEAADSPTNLMWRLQNDFAMAANMAKANVENSEETNDEPSFTEFSLDVRGSSNG
ncbi:PilT/PilU family type 4a pilus ATPase [Lampropedia aestuarii]|uniref:PilT/PilU family type 4a pilus ATPase n=1 Tax=Lampropedia aestuarii TaxID=2562762 RepID=A0A4S5BJY6_9BURK|nr:PilT/PilU family type 4a pilus ATPase [Lampropedia aestuarii]MDH5859231.1 PilT/PilU family type 4a pilus ATPase [Lampropedia aestuarii]THJ32650.1 PilT/PilU family type 4a pilus ATPase [Lampropedia aestuarii]